MVGLEVELKVLGSAEDRPKSHLSRNQDCGRELATRGPCLQRKEKRSKDGQGEKTRPTGMTSGPFLVAG
jgi:hypothetical protein